MCRLFWWRYCWEATQKEKLNYESKCLQKTHKRCAAGMLKNPSQWECFFEWVRAGEFEPAKQGIACYQN